MKKTELKFVDEMVVVNGEEVTLSEWGESVMENKTNEVVGNQDQEVNETSENENVENQEVTNEETLKKSGKWFEQEGAFPYNEGDVVQIISGKDLLLRKAVVVKPSAKKDAVKAQLIHPITGDLQKTQCSFDFNRLLLIESKGEKVNEPLTELQSNEETIEKEAI